MKFRQLGYIAGCMLLVALLVMINPTYRQVLNEVNVVLVEQAQEKGLLQVEMPVGATNVVENACEVQGVVAGDVTFKLKGVAWEYRCAVDCEPMTDISGVDESFAVQSETEVMGCPAVVSVNEGEMGKIIWTDPNTGAVYSLVMADKATADTLQSIANLMHTPLK